MYTRKNNEPRQTLRQKGGRPPEENKKIKFVKRTEKKSKM